VDEAIRYTRRTGYQTVDSILGNGGVVDSYIESLAGSVFKYSEQNRERFANWDLAPPEQKPDLPEALGMRQDLVLIYLEESFDGADSTNDHIKAIAEIKMTANQATLTFQKTEEEQKILIEWLRDSRQVPLEANKWGDIVSYYNGLDAEAKQRLNGKQQEILKKIRIKNYLKNRTEAELKSMEVALRHQPEDGLKFWELCRKQFIQKTFSDTLKKQNPGFLGQLLNAGAAGVEWMAEARLENSLSQISTAGSHKLKKASFDLRNPLSDTLKAQMGDRHKTPFRTYGKIAGFVGLGTFVAGLGASITGNLNLAQAEKTQEEKDFILKIGTIWAPYPGLVKERIEILSELKTIFSD
jgi:hypothetical protein